jgi:peptide/nickel transport system permease protein
MGLVGFAIRRIFLLLVMLIGTTMITFVVSNLIPGDPVSVNLGQSAMSDPETVAAFRRVTTWINRCPISTMPT